MKATKAIILLCATISACSSDDGKSVADAGTDASGDAAMTGDGEAGDGQVTTEAGADGGQLTLDLRYLPFTKAGSRLKARVMQVPGSPPVFLSWYDSELKTDCVSRPAEDGKIRCLPSTSLNPRTVRRSADCTGPSALLDDQSCGPHVHSLLGGNLSEALTTCENRGFGLSAETWEISAWSGSYSEMRDSCIAHEMAPPGSAELGARTPNLPTDFVALTYRNEEVAGSGLELRFEEGADGSSRVVGAAKKDEGLCSYRPLARGPGYCTPFEAAAFEEASPTYIDAQCTQLAAFTSPDSTGLGCGIDPVHAIVSGEASDFNRIGAELGDADMAYVPDGDDCVAKTVAVLKSEKQWVGRLFAVTDELSPLTRLVSVRTGDGPMRTRYRATTDGIVVSEGYDEILSSNGSGLAVSTFFENADGTGCAVWQTSDDAYRCFPTDIALNISPVRMFADAACTMRVADSGTWLTQAGKAPSLIFELEQTGCATGMGGGVSSSERLTTLWSVTGAAAGMLYTDESGACSEHQMAQDGQFVVSDVATTGYAEIPTALIE